MSSEIDTDAAHHRLEVRWRIVSHRSLGGRIKTKQKTKHPPREEDRNGIW